MSVMLSHTFPSEYIIENTFKLDHVKRFQLFKSSSRQTNALGVYRNGMPAQDDM